MMAPHPALLGPSDAIPLELTLGTAKFAESATRSVLHHCGLYGR